MNFDTFGVPYALHPHVSTEAVLGAEVLWALKTCVSHYSNNSCSDAAKEKSDELTVLSQELDSKLLELKNFSTASTITACI